MVEQFLTGNFQYIFYQIVIFFKKIVFPLGKGNSPEKRGSPFSGINQPPLEPIIIINNRSSQSNLVVPLKWPRILYDSEQSTNERRKQHPKTTAEQGVRKMMASIPVDLSKFYSKCSLYHRAFAQISGHHPDILGGMTSLLGYVGNVTDTSLHVSPSFSG